MDDHITIYHSHSSHHTQTASFNERPTNTSTTSSPTSPSSRRHLNTSAITDVTMSCEQITDAQCGPLLAYAVTPAFRVTGFTAAWTRAAAMTSVVALSLSNRTMELPVGGGGRSSCSVTSARRFACSLKYPKCEGSHVDGEMFA